MKYIINIEQKVLKNEQTEIPYCNIISTKDSIITRIISSKGIELVDTNDSVKKDDILISGDIKYNEEIKKQVCATGIVYGRTWYTINIKIPIYYETYIKQDKTRNNIIIVHNNKTHTIFKPRIENYIKQNKEIMNIFGTKIYLQKEIEVITEQTKYTEAQLEKLINQKIEETMKKTLKGKSQILDRKVLKKTMFNSTIELELFIVAEEQISTIKITEQNTEQEN